MKDKIKVRRAPTRGRYEPEIIRSILDRDFICHVGFVHEEHPVVIPTLFGRLDNTLYLHGSIASRMMKTLEKGVEVSVSVTIVDGLVLARSAFHHSMNYESVVLFGRAMPVTNTEEKLRGLKAISDQVLAGRWEEVRPPSDNEMKATALLKLPIEEASAKIRTGPPVDNQEDYSLDIWAGEIPVKRQFLPAIPDPKLRKDLEPSPSVLKLKNR